MPFSPDTAAQFIATAHSNRDTYRNLPVEIAPTTSADAYAAQEALVPLWTPTRGPVAGLKIAVTTKIMQALMGIDHPCGGMIYQNQIHTSPFALDAARYMHVVIECELAVRLKHDLPAIAMPYDRASVRAAIGSIMPAFELIEDRRAVYRDTKPLSLIADNAWNAGIVLGPDIALPPDLELDGLTGTLETNSGASHQGKTDDPLGALAWVANLAVSRGRPMTAGMVVITGSLIPTLPIPVGERFRFSIQGVGAPINGAPKLNSVEMTAV
jgi:2-keto-4-pentenoate hydratase